MKSKISLSRRGLVFGVFLSILPPIASGDGLRRNGYGARSMAKAGASAADKSDPFASVTVNPALLSYIDGPDLALSAIGAIGKGAFENGTGFTGGFDKGQGFFPEISLRGRLNDRAGVGFSLLPEFTRDADWIFEDPRGGIDGNTTYGRQIHQSRLVNTRMALGIGWEVSDTLSVGVSAGLVHNQNRLRAPYTFQSHPVLAGFKTLLDLETEGFGGNADIGILWDATENVTVALSYRTPTKVHTTGTANGDIRAQFDSLGLNAAPSGFLYDAEVETNFPDVATAGVSWSIDEWTTVSTQVEWIGWEDAYDSLPVSLSNGSNAAINEVLGSSGIDDTIPLSWEDRCVYRLGLERRLSPEWSLRAGYTYGKSPVPDETLLPMTAAISEHTLGLGLGFESGPYDFSLAYQYDLPSSRQIGNSRILSSEYDNSNIDLQAHWFGLTVSYNF